MKPSQKKEVMIMMIFAAILLILYTPLAVIGRLVKRYM